MTDIAASFVKLAVRFNPMQPKRVQECRETLHFPWTHPVSEHTFSTLILHTPTSMMHRMHTVQVNHIRKTNTNMALPTRPSNPNARSRVMSQSTSDSCACASESAQRRKYEAVCEMQPRQNSIV